MLLRAYLHIPNHPRSLGSLDLILQNSAAAGADSFLDVARFLCLGFLPRHNQSQSFERRGARI